MEMLSVGRAGRVVYDRLLVSRACAGRININQDIMTGARAVSAVRIGEMSVWSICGPCSANSMLQLGE